MLRPRQPPLLRCTIPEHFASVVARHGDRPAVIARAPPTAPSEETLTYAALDLASNRLARSLASLGVQKGHRVAVSLGNCAEFAALTYALYKLGAVLVPLNPTFNAQQLGAALRHLGAELLVIGAVTDLAYKPGRGRCNEPLLRQLVGDLRAPRSAAAGLQSECVPCLRAVVVVDNRAAHPGAAGAFDLGHATALTPYEEMLRASSDRPVTPDEALEPSDTINIQFTSGTTSAPKAAMLSHDAILNNGRFIADRLGLDPSDRIVVPPPLFHCFGSVVGYMATATTGAALLLPSPAFDPHAALRMCADHEATGLYGVSTMFIAMLDALEEAGGAGPSEAPRRRPRHLTKGIVAGSSVPEALMGRITERLGMRDLAICYGMTETAPVSVMTRASDPPAERRATVGTPMPHTAVKIVSPAGDVVPLHTRGELAVRGYLVMKGYFNDPARTAEVLVPDDPDDPAGGEEEGGCPDGIAGPWMLSGDEAQMDERGFVRVTGRIKELIIRGGENIHPLEIEECIARLPGVTDVAVCGVPDARLGEAVAAFVILRGDYRTVEDARGRRRDGGGEEGISRAAVRAHVAERLSGHLVPKYVFWVDEHPKTASGKIMKYKLREMVRDRLEEGL
ncbi:putative acyl-CoA synthetase YngI [Escovopsis weberi]|uniref:Putative acyl-CoA synthetase YngI n=1 Tax=Escovopsis weberi TaxID=150374 RepID=A0A0M9VVJ5_ESCWE|nr:putative acyl-CoA synthetase YngI [Escovopsis weberi]